MLRRAAAVLGGVLLLLVLDGLWAANAARNALTLADATLRRGTAALQGGDPATAQASFRVARDAAADLEGALRHPLPLLAGVLPGLREDVRALRSLADVTDLVGASGEHLVAAARAAGWFGDETLPLLADGRVRLEPVERAAPDLVRAARGLSRATDLAVGATGPGLFPALRSALDRVTEGLRANATLVRKAADAAVLLPPALGADEPRRYLLAFLNLNDPRASGGFLGMYGLLEAREGALRLGEVAHANRLPPVRPSVELPRELERLFGVFGSARRLYQTTYPPDFPNSARIALAVWERSGGPPVDGVLALDPVALAGVLAATGPVEVPAWPEPLSAANAVEVLERETFLLPQPTSDRVQEAIARSVIQALFSRKLDAARLAPALTEAAAARHLQLYMTREEEQRLVARMGAAGDPAIPANPLMVAWQGASASRAGYFAEPSIDYRAELGRDGSARVTLRAALRNTAPHGPPSILLGDGNGEPVGGYTAYAMVVLPEGARVGGLRLDGRPAPLALRGSLEGHPVLLGLVETRSGERRVLEVGYELPPGSLPEGGFELGIVPAPALRPTPVRVEIVLPPGADATTLPPGARAEGGLLGWAGAPTEPLRLSFRFS
jgi:hypothetical protein